VIIYKLGRRTNATFLRASASAGTLTTTSGEVVENSSADAPTAERVGNVTALSTVFTKFTTVLVIVLDVFASEDGRSTGHRIADLATTAVTKRTGRTAQVAVGVSTKGDTREVARTTFSGRAADLRRSNIISTAVGIASTARISRIESETAVSANSVGTTSLCTHAHVTAAAAGQIRSKV